MSTINGISSNVYSNYQNTTTAVKEAEKTDKNTQDTAASAKAEETTTTSAKKDVYESSSEKPGHKTQNAALIAQLKADSQNRIDQMKSLVEKMFSKQGITIGKADDMWKMLASGNFTADADTIAQAKEDISEDGYWGVKQTSERIFSFAKALSGGDTDTMEKMRKAFEKGFGQATKSWGKSLPSISQQTYDAVEKMFDDYAKEAKEKTDADLEDEDSE